TFNAVCRSTHGGHTTISSRVCSKTCGRKAAKNSSVCAGFLYIFQFAVISFLRAIRIPFNSSFVYLRVLCGFRLRAKIAKDTKDTKDLYTEHNLLSSSESSSASDEIFSPSKSAELCVRSIQIGLIPTA